MKPITDPKIHATIQAALEEDIGSGDVTSNSIIPGDVRMRGQIIAKQDGVIAGLDVAQAVYLEVDPQVDFRALVQEGGDASCGQVLAVVSGKARSLLTAERTALNFLGRMSGIATLTRRYVKAVAGTQAVILDTRKTAPGLRQVDKLAVLRGGGRNHRVGLFDMILIKDNHIDISGSITEAVRRARAAGTDLEIEVEARTLDDVDEALRLGVQRILLDNMSPEMMRQAVRLRDDCAADKKGKVLLEASGNITQENIRIVAETGVDFISSGALTHSARVLDVSFDYQARET